MSMFSNDKPLAEAVDRLTKGVNNLGEQMRAGLATKADLTAMEARIVAAFGERIDPEKLTELTGELKTADDALAASVAKNQP